MLNILLLLGRDLLLMGCVDVVRGLLKFLPIYLDSIQVFECRQMLQDIVDFLQDAQIYKKTLEILETLKCGDYRDHLYGVVVQIQYLQIWQEQWQIWRQGSDRVVLQVQACHFFEQVCVVIIEYIV